MKDHLPCATFALLCGLTLCGAAHSLEVSGYLGSEARFFSEQELDPRQHSAGLSLSAQPEFYHAWDDGYQSLSFIPFLRLDQRDARRTHFDIRELTWLKSEQDWELRVGIRKVFWGVTESQHLVDIINQTDLVENLDGEDKLGQPMLNLALIRDWGTVDLFFLPGFRERSFPGVEGRLRSPPPVQTDRVSYSSAAGQKHLDFALRWSHTMGDWDMGLSHFYGTSRDPVLRLSLNDPSNPVLQPHYDIIHQTGLDIQATKGSWLLKLEAIRRQGQGDTFVAMTTGFEYTFFGLQDSATDLGIVVEYLYDDRHDAAPVPFENDLLLGVRLALNDVQSTDALLGVIQDLDSSARFFSIEASRRLGSRWKLNLEARFISSIPASDVQFGLRQDDHLQLELLRYF